MKRGRKPNEPVIEVKKSFPHPTPPTDLDEEGKRAWASTCADLDEQGTLHKTDTKLIELYSRSYSVFRRVENQLAQEELSLIAENGRAFINPLANVYTSLLSRLRQLLCDLGLAPRTRGKSNKDEGDEMTEFLKRRNGTLP